MSHPRATESCAPETSDAVGGAKAVYESPFGRVELSGRRGTLVRVRLGPPTPEGRGKEDVLPSLRPFVKWLRTYFWGRCGPAELSSLALAGAGEFDLRVLRALAAVPFGRVITYGELAERASCPGGARAVGGAVGRNPVPLFIPCHRVIRADGRAGGFSSGLRWKTALLRHEGWTVAGDGADARVLR